MKANEASQTREAGRRHYPKSADIRRKNFGEVARNDQRENAYIRMPCRRLCVLALAPLSRVARHIHNCRPQAMIVYRDFWPEGRSIYYYFSGGLGCPG